MWIFVVHKPESSNKTIRMPNSMIEKMGEIAAQKDISFNQLVVQCCEYALQNLKKPSFLSLISQTPCYERFSQSDSRLFCRHLGVTYCHQGTQYCRNHKLSHTVASPRRLVCNHGRKCRCHPCGRSDLCDPPRSVLKTRPCHLRSTSTPK